ncbi:hypothetical protein [Streptomyces sp. NPDC059564]|uniref:hypothetical protein n=1 Tax=Streptomyces sp. NPDC059564 TaxID=3346865 RepID=UPI0036B6CFA1
MTVMHRLPFPGTCVAFTSIGVSEEGVQRETVAMRRGIEVRPRLGLVWWMGFGLSAVLLGCLWAVVGLRGGVFAVLVAAGFLVLVGVLPAHLLARAGLRRIGIGVPAWTVHLLAALAWAVALSFLYSLFLSGLPHGWSAAWSWDGIRSRTVWIAGPLVPASVGTHLGIRVWDFARRP